MFIKVFVVNSYRKTDADKEYRYLFFNKMTLAVKSSLYPFSSNGSLAKGLMITSEMAHALCELHEDLEKYVFFFIISFHYKEYSILTIHMLIRYPQLTEV